MRSTRNAEEEPRCSSEAFRILLLNYSFDHRTPHSGLDVVSSDVARLRIPDDDQMDEVVEFWNLL